MNRRNVTGDRYASLESIGRREALRRAGVLIAAGAVGGSVLGQPAAVRASGGEVELAPRYYPRKGFKPAIDLSGKLAVITGASRGNGRAVGEALASIGVNVIGTSRDPGSVPDPPNFPLLPLDITDLASVFAFRSALMSHPIFLERGHVDILVNNAGRMVVGQIVPQPPTDFAFYLAQRDLGIRTLYTGHVVVTNAILPLLPQIGYARIVFTVSIGGYETGAGIPGASMLDIYFASKAAILAYANNLDSAFRAGGSNIRVSTVNPYTMNTALAMHPNPIYTQPVNSQGLSDTDPIFSGAITFLRQLLAGGLPISMVGETFAQSLQMADPEQNVLVASPREPFATQGANALNEAGILAENKLSAIPFTCR